MADGAKEKEKVVIEEGAAPPAGKSSKTKLIVIIVAAVLVLGGGGGAAYFFVLRPKLAAAKSEAPAGAEGESEGESGHGESAAHGDEHGGKKEAASEHGAKGGHGAKGATESNNVPLEPFIVNLNDPAGNRYLKVDMVLEMRGQGCVEAIAAKRERLRDSIILLLRSKTMADLQDVDGVLNLKKEVITRANYEQDHCKALDLLFTDLVIQ